MAIRQRPAVHFAPVSNWINDPNGLVHWNGFYHLFYQYRELDDPARRVSWGHARSRDLFSWEDLPLALVPTAGSVDGDGCWSGCAVVHEGRVHLLYTGVSGATQRPCLARALDDDLVAFEKSPRNPLIAAAPFADALGFRDHTVRRTGGVYRQLIGSGTAEHGGCVVEYESPDLLAWTYRGVFASAATTGVPGTMWECPDLFRLGERWHLLFSSHLSRPVDVRYLSGSIEGDRFVPSGSGRLDLGSRWYAPQSFDAPDGRRIVFGWLREAAESLLPQLRERIGVLSLPRVLQERDDGSLAMSPCEELAALRVAAFVPVEASGVTTRLAAPRPAGAVDVELDDPGGPGPLEVELLDAHGGVVARVAIADGDVRIADGDVRIADGDVRIADGDVRIADGDVRIADGDVRIASAPSLASPAIPASRSGGRARVVFDGGICEAFSGEGTAASELLYGTGDVDAVTVHARAGADRSVVARAFELRNASL